MKAKIFQAAGRDQIAKLDGEITDWIERSGAQVAHMNTAMAQVADDPNGERWQHLVVTILYE